MKNLDSRSHVRGESVYLDDIPLLRGTLFACVFDSPVAHGKLKSVNISQAENCAGVHKIILAKDIVGENQIGGIVPDEPLLADATAPQRPTSGPGSRIGQYPGHDRRRGAYRVP